MDEFYLCIDCNMICRLVVCYEVYKDINEGKKLSEC